MSNKVKDIELKKRLFYFFNGIIDIIIFDPNKLKQIKTHTKIFLLTTLDM